MSILKYHEFMKPILEVLNDKVTHSRKELYKNLSQWAKLTDAEMQEWLPSGKQLVYKNRIGWALTYLKKANLIDGTDLARLMIEHDVGVAIENMYHIKRVDTDYFNGV